MAHNMVDQHYSLRWNHHPENILKNLSTLLQSEDLVDVTLICGKDSLRAHRIILSACSPFFQKIFAETPCNHPIVVLNEFKGSDVQALINFMYKGEVNVSHSALDSFMKAAESLQIRGLGDKDSLKTPDPVHAVIYEGDESGCGTRYLHQHCVVSKNPEGSPAGPTTPIRMGSVSPSSSSNYEQQTPKQPKRTFNSETPSTRSECQSPTTRRKQARPRRRSGDNYNAQDLSTSSPRSPVPPQEDAENLCIKKEDRPVQPKKEFSSSSTPDLSRTPEMEMRDYRTSPLSLLQGPINMNPEMDNHPHLPFPPMPSVSALAMTQPQGKCESASDAIKNAKELSDMLLKSMQNFGLDAHQPLSMFPTGLENCRSNFFEMNHRAQEHGLVKKKLGRPKGQHSAPRGGPPRSWTNIELKTALQCVWNKKMTTSQASRVYGIPYNSLLMYVRGKYGKSLKLDTLREECEKGTGSPTPTTDLNSVNNNNTVPVVKNERDSEPVQPNSRPPSVENQPPPQHPPAHPHFLNPFMGNFYPEFNSFSLPMMHQFMPPSDRSREFSNQRPQSLEVDNSEALDEDSERFRSPPRSIEERRNVVQQNGQN